MEVVSRGSGAAGVSGARVACAAAAGGWAATLGGGDGATGPPILAWAKMTAVSPAAALSAAPIPLLGAGAGLHPGQA
mgnify:CR=1 FL=1